MGDMFGVAALTSGEEGIHAAIVANQHYVPHEEGRQPR
jgi:hypothetical protein